MFINDAKDVVYDNLDHLVACNSHMNRLDGYPAIKVVVDQTFIDAGKSKVAVISGGGSGHEPAFAGYVGHGLLAAAVAGDLFASPTEEAVLAAIRAVTGPAGCLIIVMNYTGDRIQFGAAAERAKAEGYKVELIAVSDDCALEGKPAVGRRGIAGGMMVLKTAGALAATGASLEEVTSTASHTITSIGTMGCATSIATLPGREVYQRFAPGEMEMGLGLHGEPGAYKGQMTDIDTIIKEKIRRIAQAEGAYLPIHSGDEVCILVNNLGGATVIEMGVTAMSALKAVKTQLKAVPVRAYCHSFITSMDMKGVSLSLLKLPKGDAAIKVLDLLDAPTNAPAWPRSSGVVLEGKTPLPVPTGPTDHHVAATNKTNVDPLSTPIGRCLKLACEQLLASKQSLDEIDAKVGDGDCGSTVAAGAQSILDILYELPLDDPASTALALAHTVGLSMGGTSGGIYRIFFASAGGSLQATGNQWTVENLSEAIDKALAAVQKYGGAVPGDRTMLDALLPAADALHEAKNGGKSAVEAAGMAADAAENGAKATASMIASAGRSAYVPTESLAGVQDPGAVSVAVWVRAVATEMAK